MAMLNNQTVADKMPNRMLDRQPDGMSEYICQKEYQFECQNMCQIEYLAGSLEDFFKERRDASYVYYCVIPTAYIGEWNLWW